jgi:hypothetical protein
LDRRAAYDIAFYTADYDNESYMEIATRLHSQYLLLPQIQGSILGSSVSAKNFLDKFSSTNFVKSPTKKQHKKDIGVL